MVYSNLSKNIPSIVYTLTENNVVITSLENFCEFTGTSENHTCVLFRIKCSGSWGPRNSSSIYWLIGMVQYQNPYKNSYKNSYEYDLSAHIIAHINNSSTLYYGYIDGYNKTNINVTWGTFNISAI